MITSEKFENRGPNVFSGRGEVHQRHDLLPVTLEGHETPTDGEPIAEHLDFFPVDVEQVDRLLLTGDDRGPVGLDAVLRRPSDDHGRIVETGELGDRHVVLGERVLAVPVRQHVDRGAVEPTRGRR